VQVRAFSLRRWVRFAISVRSQPARSTPFSSVFGVEKAVFEQPTWWVRFAHAQCAKPEVALAYGVRFDKDARADRCFGGSPAIGRLGLAPRTARWGKSEGYHGAVRRAEKQRGRR